MTLLVKIRTEVEKAFGEHKQVMEFRIKKMDDRLAAFIVSNGSNNCPVLLSLDFIL